MQAQIQAMLAAAGGEERRMMGPKVEIAMPSYLQRRSRKGRGICHGM